MKNQCVFFFALLLSANIFSGEVQVENQDKATSLANLIVQMIKQAEANEKTLKDTLAQAGMQIQEEEFTEVSKKYREVMQELKNKFLIKRNNA